MKPEKDQKQEEGIRQRERQKQQRGHKVELLLSVSNRLLLGSGWAVDG